jgi:hypothetical protein
MTERTGKLRLTNKDSFVLVGLPGQDSQGRRAGAGEPGQSSLSRTAEQESQDRTAVA